MKKLFYLLLVVPFAFSSCEKEKCENCTIAVELLFDQPTQDSIDVVYLETMNMTYEDYINSLYASGSGMYCGDDLTDIKKINEVLPGFYRYYADCN